MEKDEGKAAGVEADESFIDEQIMRNIEGYGFEYRQLKRKGDNETF
jgi:hypothetical protein